MLITGDMERLKNQYCGREPTECPCPQHDGKDRRWWGGRTVNARMDSRTLRIVGDIRKSVEEAYSAKPDKEPYVEYDHKRGIIPLPR